METTQSKPLTYEEYLEKFGSLTYTFRGVSMLPMLRQRKNDLVTIRKKGAERCKKYDVALYHPKNQPGRYVLHRIVAVREKDYVFLGDNCVNAEVGIPEEEVIGVLSAFHRGKRTIYVTDKPYLVYSKLWVSIYPFRMVCKRIRGLLSRVYHGLRRRLAPAYHALCRLFKKA